MLLAVDAGNSSVSFGVFEGRRFVARFHLTLAEAVVRDVVCAAVMHVGLLLVAIAAVALASVGSQLTELQTILGHFGDVFTVRVDPHFGMLIAYANPIELG